MNSKGQDNNLYSRYLAGYEQEQQRLPARMLLLAGLGLVVFLIVILLWAAFSHVQTQVAVRGKLVSRQPPAVIQPVSDGLVRKWLVDAGHVVKKGDTLLVLDSTISEADLQSAQLSLWESQSSAKRLEAEIKNKQPERFSDDEVFHRLAKQLFLSRQAAHKARVDALASEQAQLNNQLTDQKKQKRILKQEVATLKELDAIKAKRYESEQERYQKQGPRRVDFLQTRVEYLKQQRALAQLESAILQSETLLADTAVREAQYHSERQAKLTSAFNDASRAYAQASAQIQKYQQAQKVVALKAPFDGVVLESLNRAPGTVVQKGQTLLTLAASNQPVQAHVYISPDDIARVEKERAVRIKLDTLPFTRHGSLEGSLEWISPDVVPLPDNPKAYGYSAKVEVTGHLRNEPDNFRLLPGMTLEANIATGSRSILSYLVYPVHRALEEGFREP